MENEYHLAPSGVGHHKGNPSDCSDGRCRGAEAERTGYPSLSAEDKRRLLDSLYYLGIMNETEAEDYRAAYLTVSVVDLMDGEVVPEYPESASPASEPWGPDNPNATSGAISGRPKRYSDKTRGGLIQRSVHRKAKVGRMVLERVLSARKGRSYAEVPYPGSNPAPTDSDAHGVSWARAKRTDALASRPTARRYARWISPDGRTFYSDRITGEAVTFAYGRDATSGKSIAFPIPTGIYV